MVSLCMSLVKPSEPGVWGAIYSYTKELPMVMLLDFSFWHFIRVFCLFLSSLVLFPVTTLPAFGRPILTF